MGNRSGDPRGFEDLLVREGGPEQRFQEVWQEGVQIRYARREARRSKEGLIFFLIR